ncbi:baseplate hub protein, partial [Succinivibrio sp.]|uniref:baseplate hub protein n=1 Tax=Succinivibrio sp. TaxID=2053619 RepID=UPI0038652F92
MIEIKNLLNNDKKLNSQPRTSFLKRKLKILLTLQKGSFKGREGNTYEISDLAMSVRVEKTGAPDFGKASAVIYGLPLDVMEQLSTLCMHPLYVRRNYINIYAGDEYNGYNQIYAGTITKASVDFNSAPDIKFNIESQIGFFGAVTAQGANVISGSQSASTFIEQQAKKIGFTFKNEGVTGTVKNAVFEGSPIEQARQCAKQIGAELILDDETMILVSNGASRKGNAVLLNANSGLLGYPAMTQNGIEIRAIFNPNFRFAGLIKLETLVPKCSGSWRIVKMSHTLDSNLPSGGKWETQIT